MQNRYYNEMVEQLMKNPEGMRVGRLARAIYNASCDLFDLQAGIRFQHIYQTTSRYLWRQSKLSNSPFERRRWGIYALRSGFVHQLELTFDEWEDDGPLPRSTEVRVADSHAPYMLNLFNW